MYTKQSISASACRRLGSQRSSTLLCHPWKCARRGLTLRRTTRLSIRNKISSSRHCAIKTPGSQIYIIYYPYLSLEVLLLFSFRVLLLLHLSILDRPKTLFAQWWLQCWARLGSFAIWSKSALGNTLMMPVPSPFEKNAWVTVHGLCPCVVMCVCTAVCMYACICIKCIELYSAIAYSTRPRAMKDLENHAKAMDTHYDKCQDAWCTGEAEKFTGEKRPVNQPCMDI